MKRTALKRYTSLRPISPKRKSRVGKLGIVRLCGADMAILRADCWMRDGKRCQDCGKLTLFRERFEGDPHAYHMAHIRTKRNNGDTLGNVRCKCGACHHKEHNPKAVPSKHAGIEETQ